MIHDLSRVTTYLQTFMIHPETGEHIMRSYATGFFVREKDCILLVTNWHVFSGIDPATPSILKGDMPPLYFKATMLGKSGQLTEVKVPLYSPDMEPFWYESSLGSEVDMAFYRMPLSFEQDFIMLFVDIQEGDIKAIPEIVGKEVFILGFPFRQDEMREVFGGDVPYFLPIWKRGSIATEPNLLLNQRVLLIDSLSRAGMSGSPIFISQDEKFLTGTSDENIEILSKMNSNPEDMPGLLLKLDVNALDGNAVKCFRFLGVYSGIIGSTRLGDLGLGKCWHVSALRELVNGACKGKMPFNAPPENKYYNKFLDGFRRGQLVVKNEKGEVVKVAPLV